MSTIALIFAVMSFLAVIGSALMALIRVVQWSKGAKTGKALICAVIGWGLNGFLQLFSGILFLISRDGDIGMFWAGLGISAICTAGYYAVEYVQKN